MVKDHEIFPEKINVSFAEIVDKNNIKLAVWEKRCRNNESLWHRRVRGCASAMKLGLASNNLNISLPGGILEINIDPEGDIHKTGPVELEYSSSMTMEKTDE